MWCYGAKKEIPMLSHEDFCQAMDTTFAVECVKHTRFSLARIILAQMFAYVKRKFSSVLIYRCQGSRQAEISDEFICQWRTVFVYFTIDG